MRHACLRANFTQQLRNSGYGWLQARDVITSGLKGYLSKVERRKKKERKLVITMAKLRMSHASTHGARKLPGP